MRDASGFRGFREEAAGAMRSIDYYAENFYPHHDAGFAEWRPARSGFRSALSLVVWTLKREVRAFGGCLGMHRR